MRLFTPATRAHALATRLHRRFLQRAGEFWRSRQAIAATEFVLVLPFLVAMMAGSAEVARLIVFARDVTLAATTSVEMITQNGTGKVNFIDLHFAQDSTMVIFPGILLDSSLKGTSWGKDISISMASVCFTSKASAPCTPVCTSNCTFANVVWSSGSSKRACGVNLTPVADTSGPSPATLPADVFGPGSLIVVDIIFNYTPIFAPRFFGTIPIARSAYIAPRYVPLIKYAVVSGDDGIGAECPGY
ncbi:MAG: TadE/TadG family type IV pilus assembly protein [Methylocella sp.]